MSAPVDVLAQCPFCGYDDIRRDDQAAPDNNGIVYCDQCGAEALSADAWNMRTHSAAVDELIELARMVDRSDRANRWGGSCTDIVDKARAALASIGGEA